jgi:hypothetical protein
MRCVPVLVVLVMAGCARPGGAPGMPTIQPASASAPASGIGTSELTGRVVIAPACPGPQPVDGSCPPRPVADAQITVGAGEQVLVTTTTDATGRFTVRLPAGTYKVTATLVTGRRQLVTATVQLPRSHELELTIDSGMR